MQNKRKLPKPEPITITEIISVNSTAGARKLLKRYKQEDASDYGDLQDKLLSFYQNNPDKLQVERELAQLHPHKDWILQHCVPPTTVKAENIETTNNLTDKQIQQQYSGADGKSSCACGCHHSGFDGTGPKSAQKLKIEPSYLMTVFAIASLTVITCFAINRIQKSMS